MKHIQIIFLLGIFFILGPAQGDRGLVMTIEAITAPTPPAKVKPALNAYPDFGKIPLYFVPNQGQVNKEALFYAKTSRYTLWMTREGLVFDMVRKAVNSTPKFNSHSPSVSTFSRTEREVTRLELLGANKNPEVVSLDKTQHLVNYFLVHEPARGFAGIPTAKAVLYKDIYKHIDLKVYGNENRLEYDWIIKPGGNPEDIRFRYSGGKSTAVDNEGNIIIETQFGKLIHKKPLAFQYTNNTLAQDLLVQSAGLHEKPGHCGKERSEIPARFKTTGENTYTFELGYYNRQYELIIDPVISLEYSTYLGGTMGEMGMGIKVDDSGHIVVTGETSSLDFPAGPSGRYYDFKSDDIAVVKFSKDGQSLLYSTQVGGGDLEIPMGIAVSGDRVYVTGYTYSRGIPTAINSLSGDSDAFVFMLDKMGNLKSFRYIGGLYFDAACGIDIDSSNNLYIIGMTDSTDFPTVAPYQASNAGLIDVFVCKLGSNLELLYSTYLGGSNYDYAGGGGGAIAVDRQGAIYVAGRTISSDFPTKNPLQQNFGGSEDSFICKLKPDGSDLFYSTYLGGTQNEDSWSIAVDPFGAAYVIGMTSSTDFPTKNAFQETLGGGIDAFLVKLAPSGLDVVYCTYLGGSDDEADWGAGVALDSSGSAYIASGTKSPDFPTKNAYQSYHAGKWDAFVIQFTQDGKDCYFSTYLGGTGDDYCGRIALDKANNIYISGNTGSSDFPTRNPFQPNLTGDLDIFVSKFSYPSGTPRLELNRTRLNFGAIQNQSTTAAQTFSIRNAGSGVMNWTIAVDVPWLTCTPMSGKNDGEVVVSINNSGLDMGSYIGTVTITAPDALNSPQLVQVKVSVYSPQEPGGTGSPFGFFETPQNGAYVYSSIPVTGWALDDIQVESVKIYREEETNLVFIGDAVFVEGARPDVELTYPNYPNGYKAGWGYMLLTNFLPNGGNGNFTLQAIATDIEGHQVTLGKKTIECDNAHTVKPFGAIDTPAQGGGASGNSFRNQGWVLTPPPNKIPVDGHTILVWIDGINIGNPVYNIYRSDIATLFPGYANSNGAMAYLDFDTGAYENGVHTIQWTAIDDAGNTDGIGSRYFTVQNTNNRQKAFSDNNPPPYPYKPEPGLVGENSGEELPPIMIKKGYDPAAAPQAIYSDNSGNFTIDITELERLEIDLTAMGRMGQDPTNAHQEKWQGSHLIGDRFSRLPIGSTLEPLKGVFCWTPGPGFTGSYRLVFTATKPNGESRQIFVTVNLHPKFGKE